MGEKKNGGEKKKNGDGGEKKKEESPLTVVLKIDIHCDGCATKICKTVRGFEGVEQVKAESGSNKVTVIGKVDPSKIREKLAEKTKKKVDLISPQPTKKENNSNNDDKKKSEGKNNNNNTEEKKPKEKEPPVTTAVLKLNLHCTGCVEKIHRTITKTKGFHEMSVDRAKDLVTVKGTMDMKALAHTLHEKLKRPVDIVPPKKEKDGEGAGGKDGGNKGGGGGGGKKKGGGDGGQEQQEGGGGGGAKMEEISRMETMGHPGFPYGYGYGHVVQQPVYGYGYPPVYAGEQLHPHAHADAHAPQMFSDENPNACSIM